MSDKIVPPFNHMPDVDVARVFSEFFVKSTEFKIFGPDNPSTTTDFPPEKAYQTSVITAYIQPNGRISTKFAFLPADSHGFSGAEDGDALIRGYEQSVSLFQGMTDALAVEAGKAGRDEVHRLGNFAIECSKQAKLRIVASIVGFAAVGAPHTRYTGFVIPKRTYQTTNLALREELLDLQSLLGRSTFEARVSQGDTRINEILRMMIQNHPNSAILGFAAAALAMPKLDAMKRIVAAGIEELPMNLRSSSNYARNGEAEQTGKFGGTRAERRRQNGQSSTKPKKRR